MVTPNQERYLLTIPENRIAIIKPYDPGLKGLADELIKSIHIIYPELEILFMGAAGLGIAGQGDIDLYVLCKPSDFGKYLPRLKALFGEPVKERGTFIAWEFDREGVPVQLYLTDPGDKLFNTSMKEQIDIYNILKGDPKLLKEYEDLKVRMNGKSLREYQSSKYEFYNRILALN